MVYPSEVPEGLTNIAATIRTLRAKLESSKVAFGDAVRDLNGLPTIHAELIAAINAMAGSDAYEQSVKQEFARYAAEFTALKTAASAAVTALATTTEF